MAARLLLRDCSGLLPAGLARPGHGCSQGRDRPSRARWECGGLRAAVPVAWTGSCAPWILATFLGSSVGRCRAPPAARGLPAMSRGPGRAGRAAGQRGSSQSPRWQHRAPGRVHMNPFWPGSSPAALGWTPGRGAQGTAQWVQREHRHVLPSAVLPWRGQSSPSRAAILLWASGPQPRGPDRAAVPLLAVLPCWVQHPAPHHSGCRGSRLAGGWVMEGFLQPRAPPWLFQSLLGERCGVPRLPCVCHGGVFLVCEGTSPGCFALNQTLPLSGGDEQSPPPFCSALCTPAAAPSLSQGRTDISNAQASSTFLLSVLSS